MSTVALHAVILICKGFQNPFCMRIGQPVINKLRKKTGCQNSPYIIPWTDPQWISQKLPHTAVSN